MVATAIHPHVVPPKCGDICTTMSALSPPTLGGLRGANTTYGILLSGSEDVKLIVICPVDDKVGVIEIEFIVGAWVSRKIVCVHGILQFPA